MANKKYPEHCKCGQGNYGTCKNCSRIKMGIMLKNGWQFLKESSSSGKLSNPYWYNYYKENNSTNNFIIKGMVRRFNELNTYNNAAKKLIFYDNGTEIHSINL